MNKKNISFTLALAAAFVPVSKAEVFVMIDSDLDATFNRSIEPTLAASTESAGTFYVTGGDNPMSADAAMRFIDDSEFVFVRTVAQLPEPVDALRISVTAMNNLFVEDGSRGARLRITNDIIDLVTSESRVPLTVTFKQDNTIQAKGDLPDSPNALIQHPIELHTEYDVDIFINVSDSNSLTYNFNGSSHTLVPESYHVFVDGELIVGIPADGLGFAITSSGADYVSFRDSALGSATVDQIGFVSATADAGVDWYFSNMFIMTGDSISDEGNGGSEGWYGYDVPGNHWVDTGAWMGLVYVANDPWIYSLDLQNWVYISADGVGEAGAWSYIKARD